MADEPSLESLIASARAGDKRAFGALVQRFLPAVTATALAFVRSRESAEDVAQLAFVRAWQGLRGLKAGVAFASWLMTITRNTARNWLRDNAFEARRVEYDLGAIAHTPRGTDDDGLQALVRKLPDILREILLLRYVSDLSYEEIAEHIGEPLGVVRDRLYRAKQALQEFLKSPDS